jgi:hypothetical protein
MHLEKLLTNQLLIHLFHQLKEMKRFRPANLGLRLHLLRFLNHFRQENLKVHRFLKGRHKFLHRLRLMRKVYFDLDLSSVLLLHRLVQLMYLIQILH